MNRLGLFLAAGALLAGCGASEDRWLTPIATATSATPGETAVIATLFTPTTTCEPIASPGVQIVQEARLGTLTVMGGERLIDETGQTCSGIAQPTTVVLYEPRTTEPGFDTVVFRELRPGTRADRQHTVEIRVR